MKKQSGYLVGVLNADGEVRDIPLTAECFADAIQQSEQILLDAAGLVFYVKPVWSEPALPRISQASRFSSLGLQIGQFFAVAANRFGRVFAQWARG